VQSLFSHALHSEVVAISTSKSAVSNVPTGVEVQGGKIETGAIYVWGRGVTRGHNAPDAESQGGRQKIPTML